MEPKQATYEKDLTVSCPICKANIGQACKGVFTQIVCFRRRIKRLCSEGLARKDYDWRCVCGCHLN